MRFLRAVVSSVLLSWAALPALAQPPVWAPREHLRQIHWDDGLWMPGGPSSTDFAGGYLAAYVLDDRGAATPRTAVWSDALHRAVEMQKQQGVEAVVIIACNPKQLAATREAARALLLSGNERISIGIATEEAWRSLVPDLQGDRLVAYGPGAEVLSDAAHGGELQLDVGSHLEDIRKLVALCFEEPPADDVAWVVHLPPDGTPAGGWGPADLALPSEIVQVYVGIDRRERLRRWCGPSAGGGLTLFALPAEGFALGFAWQEAAARAALERVVASRSTGRHVRETFRMIQRGAYHDSIEGDRSAKTWLGRKDIPVLLALADDYSPCRKPQCSSSSWLDLQLSIDTGTVALWLVESIRVDALYPTEHVLYGYAADPFREARTAAYRAWWRREEASPGPRGFEPQPAELASPACSWGNSTGIL